MESFKPLVILILLNLTYFINFVVSDDEYLHKLSTIIVNPEFDSEEIDVQLYRIDPLYIADYLFKRNTVTSSLATPRNVENLHSILEHFGNDKCLVAINNFLGADIQMNPHVPVILRRFELVIVHSEMLPDIGFKYLTEKNILIWAPKERLAEINGNYTVELTDEIILNCYISQYFTPMSYKSTKNGYCVGLNPIKFSSSSKPWSCEVQIDLFMPHKLFQLGKFTQIFRCWNCYPFQVASSMLKINILVGERMTLEAFDAVAVVNWMSREPSSRRSFVDDESDFQLPTDRILFGYVNCVKTGIIRSFNCRIPNFDILFPCTECKNAYFQEELTFGELSIDSIKFLDKRKQLLPVSGVCDVSLLSKMSLDEQICYFILKEHNAIQLPLKNLHRVKKGYPDQIQILAFAYASLFKDLLGNVSWGFIPTSVFSRELQPSVFVEPIEEQIGIEFKFGQLQIVSCGSRGLEPISFLQIVTVFETPIWIFLVVFVWLIMLCSKHLTGLSLNLSSLWIGRLRIS